MIKNTDKKDKFFRRICLLLNLGDKNLWVVFFQTSVYCPLQLYLETKAEMHKSTYISNIVHLLQEAGYIRCVSVWAMTTDDEVFAWTAGVLSAREGT